MWLMNCLRPDHNTISDFRRDNPKAIKKVFRATVQIAKHFDLIGGKLIAGDSTRLRAQNSKKNNYNQAKIDRHVAYIDNKLDDFTRAMAENDGDNEQILEDIKKQMERKDGYRKLESQLKESGENQIPVSDPESRQMVIRNNIKEVAYNVQTTVEHPYGTIKRQWGFSYILTKKGMSRAGSDVGLMFIAYNLRRIGNILTAKVLKEYLRMLLSLLLMDYHHYRPQISHFTEIFLKILDYPGIFRTSLKMA
jgi:hypothetical protein